MQPRMELFTVGYSGRTLPQLVATLREHGVTRVVDVRDKPQSRKPGFSALALFEGLRKANIVYELDRALGNPEDIRDLWKSGRLAEGKTAFRRRLRNGTAHRVRFLVDLARIDRVAILCLEEDAGACHRGVIAEEAVRLAPEILIRHL
jgi:uncharacterized protein (DUF488 family)